MKNKSSEQTVSIIVHVQYTTCMHCTVNKLSGILVHAKVTVMGINS